MKKVVPRVFEKQILKTDHNSNMYTQKKQKVQQWKVSEWLSYILYKYISVCSAKSIIISAYLLQWQYPWNTPNELESWQSSICFWEVFSLNFSQDTSNSELSHGFAQSLHENSRILWSGQNWFLPNHPSSYHLTLHSLVTGSIIKLSTNSEMQAVNSKYSKYLDIQHSNIWKSHKTGKNFKQNAQFLELFKN